MKRNIFDLAVVSSVLIMIISIIGYASVFRKTTTVEQQNEIEKEIQKEIDLSRSESMKLQQIEPNDVESMKIEFVDIGYEKRRPLLQKPLDRETIEGLLTLFKNAKYSEIFLPYFAVLNLGHFDYVLVTKLKNGNTIEVPYTKALTQPFGRLEEGILKEALLSLTDSLFVNIIHINEGKILDVKRTLAFPARSEYYIEYHLNKDGQIILDLQIEKFGKVIIKESRPVRYGQPQLYVYPGEGYLLVDIFYPYNVNF
jgi:hypothetical protein